MTRTHRDGTPKGLRWIAVVLSIGIVAAACGTSSVDGAPVAESREQTSTTLLTTLPSTTTSTPAQPSTATSLPALDGVPYVGPGPDAGDQVAVIGVAFDDLLMVRSGPGVEYAVVATLDPRAIGIPITGRAQLLPSSIWHEVDIDGVTGWVNSSYVALLGATDDATSRVVAAHGSIPTADTMLDLGALVSENFAGSESGTRITVTIAPSMNDLGEVAYDVIGLDDDSVVGYRLHVFGQQIDGSGPFSLHSVERTMLCFRGVTNEGLCL